MTRGRASGRGLSTCLLFGLLLTAGCVGQPHPTLKELRRLPAASIVYPGSVGPGAGGTDSDNKFGANAAVFTRIELTNATPDQILRYYAQQLLADGWTRNDVAGGGNPNWIRSWGWTKGKRRVALGILNDDYKTSLQHSDTEFNNYTTAYEIDLQ